MLPRSTEVLHSSLPQVHTGSSGETLEHEAVWSPSSSVLCGDVALERLPIAHHSYHHLC